MELLAYSAADEAAWDGFCENSLNGTFLHTRRFLNYHGRRFRDASAVIRQDGRLAALIPAAAAPDDASIVVSHPGATYGGVVHTGWMTGLRMLQAFDALRTHYAGLGYKHLRYKAVPFIHARHPAQDDLYTLFRHKAARVRCELSCALDLSARRKASERRRRGARKAQSACTFSADVGLLGELWNVIAENLARKHAASPIHTVEELALLTELFPEQVRLRCALVQGQVEAGVVFFNSPRAWHAQYIAASEKGYEVSALDGLFEEAIAEAAREGARYFDFGSSNEDEGTVLNEGLFCFKAEFGAAGVAHETYEMDLHQ